MNKYHKLSIFSGSVTAAVMLCTSVYADPSPTPTPTPSGSIIPQAIASVGQEVHALRKQINALAGADMNYQSKRDYQFDKDLPSTVTANTVEIGYKTYLQNYLHQSTSGLTANDISNSLQEIPDQVSPPNALTQNQDPNGVTRYNNEQNIALALSTGVKGSDTLYQFDNSPNHPDVAEYHTGKPSPQDIHNNYFDFNSVISPASYNTTDQQEAVTHFMQYLTQSYKPYSDGFNFSDLKNASAKQLSSFMQSQPYVNFQLAIRSLVAAKSLPLSNFNYMISERSPILSNKDLPQLDALSAKMSKAGVNIPPAKVNIKNANGDTVTEYQYPSPLQIQNYIATRRVHSKGWYQTMSAASPATVQREQLYVLAEIESQLQQQHLDNERLISTLSMLALSTTQSEAGGLKALAQPVNDEIKSVMGKSK